MKQKDALWVQNNIADIKVFDIRETEESNIIKLKGAFNIPKAQLLEKPSDYIASKDEEVYIHCRSGGRSSLAIEELEKQGYTNLINVQGGIKEMDQSFLIKGESNLNESFHCQNNNK
ncbi:MAG: rhodanese-like domain-containing protein [Mycoplasma sp.]|nr:rhodanese-like domain-containing protein [Mycoplasma sp.]